MKKIKRMIVSAAFLHLNALALSIAHPHLRKLAIEILSDAAEVAMLMLNQDLSDPTVAATVFEAQQIVAKPPVAVPTMMTIVEPYVPHGIVPSNADVPKTVRRKKTPDTDSL